MSAITVIFADRDRLAAAARAGTIMGGAFRDLPELPLAPDEIDLPPADRIRPSRRRVWAFTPRQSREHRHLARGVRAGGLDRLAEGDRAFIASMIRGRRELRIGEADRLAALAERLYWQARDGQQRGAP